MALNIKKQCLSHSVLRFWPVFVVFIVLFMNSELIAQPDDLDQIKQLRKARREASRDIQRNKSSRSGPARFGLLVIPVDFEDARLPSSWTPLSNLSDRIFGKEGHTLEHYFQVASDNQLELQITLAPLVHLEGVRDNYSDIGWNGHTRTRALAHEAISAVAQLGVEFRRLDIDGPDGQAGSGDDDGQVDGVLILHSGIGQENDTVNGEIQALQFFIDPPVVSGGTQASFYAVASLHSGLGIWAHETGHLLGMEDRYDPRLQPEAGLGDVRSLGGLGRFSLMSSGAWGAGGGLSPALPDAYSCWQLGWTTARRYPIAGNPVCSVSPWRNGGQPPVAAFTSGALGSEFFLMETRDPVASFPFDAGIPSGQMLIYHVDETVPDGWYSMDGGSDYHLRVRLVEADNDSALQEGTDDGRAEDCFPGPLNVQSFSPTTSPDSGGYNGPSMVSFEAITSHDNFVTCMVSDSLNDYAMAMSFRVGSDIDTELDLQVRSLGNSISSLTCTISLSGLGGGAFPGGETTHDVVFVESAGTWIPAEPIIFDAPVSPDSGSVTNFHFLLTADGQELPPESRPWVWLSDLSVFDFNDPDWVFWDQEFPNSETNTRWHLWGQAPYLTGDGTGVLACTGENFSSSSDWPHVQYGRRGRAAIISPPIGEDISAIQLTHAIEVEYLHAGTIMDGATVTWLGSDGALVEARPIDGWDAVISDQSDNTMGGVGAFADSVLILNELDIPQWRCDVLPLPTVEGGPWRLRLEFSSNYTWRFKGWFVAGMVPLNQVPVSAFPIAWNAGDENCPSGLKWEPPYPAEDFTDPIVEFYDQDLGAFRIIPNQAGGQSTCSSGCVLSREFILDHLRPAGLTRHLLRVVYSGPKGAVASRSVVVYPDDGAKPVGYLEHPFPNPSTGNVKFLVEVPVGEKACLKIFDLRGRLVHSQHCQTGRYQVFWDGVDDHGRRVAAGTYYLKLEGSGFSSLRKVVLIR